jgi:hypothetical protein
MAGELDLWQQPRDMEFSIAPNMDKGPTQGLPSQFVPTISSGPRSAVFHIIVASATMWEIESHGGGNGPRSGRGSTRSTQFCR